MNGLNDWITSDTKYVLLVEPNFPLPSKSRNHYSHLPIGLLKIASYLRSLGVTVELVQSTKTTPIHQMSLDIYGHDKSPDLILVTSVFTYWAEHVKNTVYYYKHKYPETPILVGGIYASLLPEHCKEYTSCDNVITGVVPEAEKLIPAYDLVDVDYQIIHTTRGCIRRCGVCGVYQIEPKWSSKKSIKDEILKKKIIFYDNNLLANPYIEDILAELIELREKKQISYLESQSGFDGRILLKKPYLAELLYDAGFQNPKIAWDGSVTEWDSIEKQIDILLWGGYNHRKISVFMLFNHDLDYLECEEKRRLLFGKRIQVVDCRYRPLDRTTDNYNGDLNTPQTCDDYHINPNWTDKEVKQFRRNVRRHNSCIRYGADWYSETINRRRISQDEIYRLRELCYDEVRLVLDDVWNPAEVFEEV